MNNECLFTVCSRAREHEQLREQLVNIGLNPAGSGSPTRRRGQGSCPVWAAPTAAKGARQLPDPARLRRQRCSRAVHQGVHVHDLVNKQ